MEKRRRPYGMTTPCANCPFRTDIKPYITKARVREIERALERSDFPCHKTVKYDDEDERIRRDGEVHCAGALIVMEKEGRSSQMMRIAERLGMYDAEKLDMDAPVFESFDDMAAAQEPRRARRRA